MLHIDASYKVLFESYTYVNDRAYVCVQRTKQIP